MKLKKRAGTSLGVQWLKLHASTAGGMGSIPGQGTRIQHATRCSQKQTNKQLARGMLFFLIVKRGHSITIHQVSGTIPGPWGTGMNYELNRECPCPRGAFTLVGETDSKSNFIM